MFKKKKLRITSDVSFVHNGGCRGSIKQNEIYRKFQSYKGTSLVRDMICKSINTDQGGKGETY